jgi:hypothetical protein
LEIEMNIATRVTTIAFAIGVAAAAASVAYAGPTHGEQQRHYRYVKHTVTTISVEIDEKVRNEIIPLRRLVQLDTRYRGYKVQKVVVRLKPRNRRGRVFLLANGRPVDHAFTRRTHIITLIPNGREILDYNTRRLQLKLDGKAHIKSIDIQIRPTKMVWKTAAMEEDLGPEGRRQQRRANFPRDDHDHDDFSRRLALEIGRVLTDRTGQTF